MQVTGDRIIARSVEAEAIDGGIHGAVEAVYEFSPDLVLLTARFSEQYWARHRALEAQGRLDHSREWCAERSGPRAIRVWEPALGWRSVSATVSPDR
jgi:hypothetical protein